MTSQCTDMMASVMEVLDRNTNHSSNLQFRSVNYDEEWENSDDDVDSEIMNVHPIEEVSGNLNKIVQELMDITTQYLKKLELCIKVYMREFEKEQSDLSSIQKELLFANIEEIFAFHENEFNRQLKECQGSIELIGKTFSKLIHGGNFYCYIVYAMQRGRSREYCKIHVKVFEGLKNVCAKSTNINECLTEPIQILTKYQELLNRILEVLTTEKNSSIILSQDLKFQQMAIRCASEALKSFLTTFNESMSISEIKEVYKEEHKEVSSGSVHSFLLVLPFSEKFKRRPTINLLAQGKFLKCTTFQITEVKLSEQYKGKLFLFEKCAIYTKKTSADEVEYRGHFCTEQMKLNWSNKKKYFLLHTKRKGQQEVEFEGNASSTIEWVNDLKNILSLTDEVDRLPTKRDSIISNISRFTFGRTSSVRSNTSRFYTEEEPQEITSNMDFLESLRTLETLYVSKMNVLKKLVFDQKQETNTFYSTLLKRYYPEYESKLVGIMILHQKKLSPIIQNGDVGDICRIFEVNFNAQVFDLYDEYAELAGKMKQLIPIDDDNEKNSPLLELLKLPIYQMKEYFQIFNGIDGNFSKLKLINGVQKQFLHAKVSAVTTAIGKKCRIVEQIFKINGIKSVVSQNMGSIVQSESVLIDKLSDTFRIFLMEKGILCIVTSLEKPHEELFNEIEFCYHYGQVKSRLSRLTNNLMYLRLDKKRDDHKILFKNQSSREAFFRCLQDLKNVYVEQCT